MSGPNGLSVQIVDYLEDWIPKEKMAEGSVLQEGVTVWAKGGQTFKGNLLQVGDWGVRIERETGKACVVLARHIIAVEVPGRGGEVRGESQSSPRRAKSKGWAQGASR